MPNHELRRAAKPKRAPIGPASLRIELDRNEDARPFFEQIRAYIRDAVAAGSLPPGVRLPPERKLAQALKVSRSTVMRAYQELVAEGLVKAAPSRGTVVAPEATFDLERAGAGAAGWMIALPPLAALGSDSGLLSEILSAVNRPGVISFASAAPPEDLIPVDDIVGCLRDAFEEGGAGLLSYGPVDGTTELRGLIAERMRAAGAISPRDSVVVLSGSTQGLALATRVFIEPGDEVVVEAPTYLGIVQTLELSGARLVGVAVDANGIRTDSLAEVLARRRIRLIVLQPNFHNPTGACMSQERREQVLWLARRHSVPILEDDAYGALYHRPPAPGSLKQMDGDGLVIYLSSFSKTLAPGLRIAWMCGPDGVIARIAVAKQYSDLNTNSIGQSVVARMISSGRYDSNLERLRQASSERMRILLRELDTMPDLLERDLDPQGGLHVWCRLKVGDAPSAVAAAARSGVAILGGTAFYPSGMLPTAGRDRVRLSLPVSGVRSIREGARRLAEALKDLPGRNAQVAARQMTVVV
jgi:DNA-binding transcriptional MocR family regulator